MRMPHLLKTTVVTALCSVVGLLPSIQASAQCNPVQNPPSCKQCTYDTTLYLTVCHLGTNYNATIELCTQFATPPNPIKNPCNTSMDTCARALDAITWVKSFCVDQDLKDFQEAAVIQAIIKGTNLCCATGNFLGITIPMCTSGTDCSTSPVAYCHILAMPRCMNKNYTTGCYESCTKCTNFCMVERRYCKTSETSCCKRSFATCSYKVDEAECETCNKRFDCSANYFNSASSVCCD